MPKKPLKTTGTEHLEDLMRAYALRRLQGAPQSKAPKPAKPARKNRKKR